MSKPTFDPILVRLLKEQAGELINPVPFNPQMLTSTKRNDLLKSLQTIYDISERIANGEDHHDLPALVEQTREYHNRK